MNVLLIARIVVVTIAFSLGAKLSSMYYGNKISLKDKAIAESILKSEKANREIERLGFELMNNVALLNIERNKESEIVKVEVVKKVIEYVQSPNSGKCDIPSCVSTTAQQDCPKIPNPPAQLMEEPKNLQMLIYFQLSQTTMRLV